MKKFTILAAVLALMLAVPPPAEATITFSVEILNLRAGAGGPGGYRFRMVEVTLDASYAAGGYAVTAANFQLNTIKKVWVVGLPGSTGSAGSNFTVTWDKTNGKLKMWKGAAAPFTEAGATDPNGLKGIIEVFGY